MLKLTLLRSQDRQMEQYVKEAEMDVGSSAYVLSLSPDRNGR